MNDKAIMSNLPILGVMYEYFSTEQEASAFARRVRGLTGNRRYDISVADEGGQWVVRVANW